jgi:DNA replication ATP-dependent helicase Dna2
MHREIMAFPNTAFYAGRLHILPPHINRAQQQKAPISLEVDTQNSLAGRLARQRVLFLPTGSLLVEAVQKTNREEAQLTAQLIRAFEQLYQANQRPFSWTEIGVITPFRAQIAMIRQTLEEADIPADQITIDTVERYQGGARDIIIISLCTNSLSQLNSMISLSEEGVDRKLNVALTRAREHLILLGNPDLLRRDTIYRQLLDFLQPDFEL